ncbi:hypothetical protein Syun_017310 [Stephania yunnanensis]|uniref:Stress response protein NST1 n=1 Tax=Stephania yunnanensis TaxID=152371 RepID=A0AAP0P2Y4_9MAGN
MPGLAQRNAQFSNAYSLSCSAGSVSGKGIWSKHRDDVTFDQLHKFWSELSPQARHELIRIDKQTLLEQARKNLYCSRCNGLLLEGFSQIVLYGKSLHQEAATRHSSIGKIGYRSNSIDNGSIVKSLNHEGDGQDPSVHPWGGLVATRDGILTLLDCFLGAKSLKALQNVFHCARVRERERELLYPDACGGGGRGWISQGMANYGRSHGARETCALHTARLSCDTLVDFWSALGDETRKSLLRMKEEDFIERLMYRFDSKRFCRDCRRNVIREFKELKELKRIRREPRCTSWFCVADTAFQYEVSDDTIQVDWSQSFIDNVGAYHHFEWAVGTAEGKSDIRKFEDVGLNGTAQGNDLDLDGLSACFITLRAYKLDGRYTEISVKAHAMKGQPCVHRRLVVGDGYVIITKGESIRKFFEHAEEAEEEEDDDAVDKDGNEFDGEGSRPQKHAKSPELAREFLLDAATIIFKEQVEKAFREGTARQNAHSIFVCLALKLLEERVHVACKEIITLEKQNKLLEEEEKEKREEEERKERKRAKEREKKLRRKERLKGKEREREKSCPESNQCLIDSKTAIEESSPSVNEESNNNVSSEDSVSDMGDNTTQTCPFSVIQDYRSLSDDPTLRVINVKNGNSEHSVDIDDGEVSTRDASESFITEQSKSSRRKLRLRKEVQLDSSSIRCDKRRSFTSIANVDMVDEFESRSHSGCMSSSSKYINGMNGQLRNNLVRFNMRNSGPKISEKFHFSNSKVRDRCDDYNSCSCNMHNGYRTKDGMHVSTIRAGQIIKSNKSDAASDMSRPFYRNNKYNHGGYPPDICETSKSRPISSNITSARDFHIKKVWEPTEESRKRYPRSNSDSDVTLKTSCFKTDECEKARCNGDVGVGQHAGNIPKSSGEHYINSSKESDIENCQNWKDGSSKLSKHPSPGSGNRCQNQFDLDAPAANYSNNDDEKEAESCAAVSSYLITGASNRNTSSTSSSDNCSSCLSEGDSSTASSSSQNVESWSTSDSEDTSQQSEQTDNTTLAENGFHKSLFNREDDKHTTKGGEYVSNRTASEFPVSSSPVGASVSGGTLLFSRGSNIENGRITGNMNYSLNHMAPPVPNQGMHLPVITAPSAMPYYHQSAASAHGLMPPLPQPSHYVFGTPLGYRLPVNRPPHYCMRYGAVQPIPTSMLNMGQVPTTYQPVNRSSFVIPKEQTVHPIQPGVQEPIQPAPRERPIIGKPIDSSEMSCPATSVNENGVSINGHSDSRNFSLFHFGGPIALANLTADSSREATGGGVSLKSSSADPAKAGFSCSQDETTIEEYSLFSANSGTVFSFLTNC